MLYIPAPPRNIANYLSGFLIPASILVLYFISLFCFTSILLQIVFWSKLRNGSGGLTGRPTTAQMFVRLWGSSTRTRPDLDADPRRMRDPLLTRLRSVPSFLNRFHVLRFRWKRSDRAFILNLKCSSKIIKWTPYQSQTFVLFFSELRSLFNHSKDYTKDKIGGL